jgi:hypothetical protein
VLTNGSCIDGRTGFENRKRERVRKIKKRDKVKRRMEKGTQREIEGKKEKKNRKKTVSIYKLSIRDPQKVTNNPFKVLK